MQIYCSKTVVHFDVNTNFNTPKIIGANHPNSFFDAIVIAVSYPKPIYFLARGDAFNNPLVAKFLTALQMIPIYRLSEGKSNLRRNEDTFNRCVALLKQNQTLLIFSEGLCINEWKLRPLKKGTARLALLATQHAIPNLKIQPTNLNYSSFEKNPKQVLVNFNSEFDVIANEKEAAFYSNFNLLLKKGLLDKLVIQIEKKEIQLFVERNATLYRVMLAIPAFIGYLLNRGIYLIFKNIAHKKTKNTVFYDSVLFGLLLIFYPIIVTISSVITGLLFNFITALLIFVCFPLSAWCYSQYKSH
jgi:1-acyl-sn-glycerol-3-phosphate acyltransferase